jgi:AraC-like DNA-binding protein
LRLRVNQDVNQKFHTNASISVVCYKSKTLSNGENPLMLQISKEGRRKYQSLGISIDQKFWDFTKNKPKPNCPDGDLIQKILLERVTEVQKQILQFSANLPYLLGSFIHASPFKSVTEIKEHDPVELSINYMLENLTKKLKVSDIALGIGYSTSHFCRLFLSKTGHSPIDYFIQLKVQKACRLLENPGWTVSDVAREMGFEDQFYFSRLFHKVMGMPPSEYRKIRI